MPKKTDLMEENEFLSEETMEGECVVLQDETGRMLTEEEAVLEEERLLMKIDNFFLANPSFPQMEAEEEEEDEEDTLVTLNKEGEIVKEVTTVLKQKETGNIVTGRLTISDSGPSLFEEQLTIHVIRKHLSKISQASMKIEEVENAFYELCEGGSLHDNIIDAIRKERNELTSLLSVKPVKLSNLKNKQLRGRLEAESRELMDKIVDLTFSFED